jgi:hypothetical protein
MCFSWLLQVVDDTYDTLIRTLSTGSNNPLSERCRNAEGFPYYHHVPYRLAIWTFTNRHSGCVEI